MPDAPDTIWRSLCRCGPTCKEVEYAENGRPFLYGHGDHLDPDAVEYARVTPSVRLARWLDAGDQRLPHTTRIGTDAWRCWLFDDDGTPFYAPLMPTRDEAITAALDQAEGELKSEGLQRPPGGFFPIAGEQRTTETDAEARTLHVGSAVRIFDGHLGKYVEGKILRKAEGSIFDDSYEVKAETGVYRRSVSQIEFLEKEH